MGLFFFTRKVLFLLVIATVFTGCSKFETSVQGTEGLSSNILQVCSPGVVSSVASDMINVSNGRCMPSCKSDGSGYECVSQAFVVCNPGYMLASGQTLACVSSGGSTTGGSTTGGSTTGGSTTGGSTTGGSTTGGSTTGGSTTGGSTTGGSTTGGSTTGGTMPRFFIDASVYNPESVNPWIEIQPSQTTSLYLGKIRLGETSAPVVKLRITASSGTLTNCSSSYLAGVEIAPPVIVSAQEIQISLKLQSDIARTLNSDFNFCGRLSNINTTTIFKLNGEVQ